MSQHPSREGSPAPPVPQFPPFHHPNPRPLSPLNFETGPAPRQDAAERIAANLLGSRSSRISYARMPPMFDGLTKSNWETFVGALSNYIWAYESEFDSDKKKISFTISLLGKEDGSRCPASNWVQNWTRRTLRLGRLRAGYSFDDFVEELD